MKKPNNLRDWLSQWDAGAFNFTDMSFRLPRAQKPEAYTDRAWERELLAGVETVPGDEPEARTEAYYAARPCPNLVASAAQLLDRMLDETSLT